MPGPSCWRTPAACAPATASTCCPRRRWRSPPRRETSRAAWERRRRRFTWPRRIPWRRRRSPAACAIRGRCWHEGLGIRRQRRYGRARPGPLHEAPDRGDREALPRNDGSVVRRGSAPRRHRRGGTEFRRRLLARAGPRGAQASRRRGARRRILRRAFLPQRDQPRLAGSRLPAGKAHPPRRFADGERGSWRNPKRDHRGNARLRTDPRPPHADGPRRRAAGVSREAMQYDLLIKNVRVVRPNEHGVRETDIAVKGEKFFTIENALDVKEAKSVYDGKGWLAFPGVVDAHMHTGIYAPLAEDAVSESRAAAQGGVTSSLNYFRSGQYYLNKGGPYRQLFPEVLELSAGRFHVDYGYHLAPMDGTHISEIPYLVEKHGVSSFKIFMFYGSHGLHGRSDSQREFLMIGPEERYDYAHFEFIMRGVQATRERFPDKAAQISLSLHCESADIITAYTKLIESQNLQGLAAYHAARPPHSEGLALFIAAYLANESALHAINPLHLS